MSPKSVILLLLATVQFTAGGVAQYSHPRSSQAFTVIFVLLCSLLIFAWYRLDADQRGYRRSVFLNAGVAALALLALPYYFIRSRGAKRGVLATFLFLLALVAYSLLSVAGQYATYYALQS